MTLGLLFSFTLLSFQQLAMALPQKALTIDFFRTPESPFRSGQTNIQDLKSQVQDKRIEMEVGLSIPSTKLLYWKSPKEIIMSSDFGLIVEANSAISPVPLNVYLFPKTDSKLIAKLASKTPFIVSKFDLEFSSITTLNGLKGFVSTKSIVSKFDLGLFAKLKDGLWVPYKKRILNDLITPRGMTIPISQVVEIKTAPSVGFDPQKSLQVLISKVRKKTWFQSYLKGHGVVHWVDPQTLEEYDQSASQLSIKDILAKQIHSISFSQKDPRVGLVSGSGIFLTNDGASWTQLPQFGNQDHPLLVLNSKDFLVGSDRTIDGGKTFQPYINFKDLSGLLTRKIGYAPKQMQLLQLKALSSDFILASVSTGDKTFYLQGKLNSQSFIASDWKIIR